jgi:hypothetical protein
MVEAAVPFELNILSMCKSVLSRFYDSEIIDSIINFARFFESLCFRDVDDV